MMRNTVCRLTATSSSLVISVSLNYSNETLNWMEPCVAPLSTWLQRFWKATYMTIKPMFGLWGQSCSRCWLASIHLQEETLRIWKLILVLEFTKCPSMSRCPPLVSTSSTLASASNLTSAVAGTSFLNTHFSSASLVRQMTAPLRRWLAKRLRLTLRKQ